MALKLFGKCLKPDYMVMRVKQNELLDGTKDLPLYVIEVKRTLTKKYNNISPTDQAMTQHFKQLRNICINYHLPFVNGVLTDFQSWFFTRCSLNNEIFDNKQD
jgi:hypothetical protein